MSEKLKDLTSEQAKNIKDINELVDKAIKNGALNKIEGEEIFNRLKLEKYRIILNSREQLLDIAKESGWTGLVKLIETKTEAQTKQSGAETTKQSGAETTKQPEAQTEQPKTEGPVDKTKTEAQTEQPGAKKEKPTEILTSADIQKTIDTINKIIGDGIHTGEEEDLTSLIKDLQDKKILKQIQGIKDGKLQKGQDLIDLGRGVISRLEKIKTGLIQEESEDVEKERLAKERERTDAENKAINESEQKKQLEEKLAREKQEFLDGVLKIEIGSTDINKYIDEKISLYEKSLDTIEDKINFKEKLLPEMKKLKISESNKTFDHLTTGVELKDKELIFKIDPKGFDSYDSKLSYAVDILDFKADNRDIIREVVLNAYKYQIDNMIYKMTS